MLVDEGKATSGVSAASAPSARSETRATGQSRSKRGIDMRSVRLYSVLAVFTIAFVTPAAAQVVELIVPQVGVTFVNYSGDLIDSDTGVGFKAGGKVRGGSRFFVEAGFFWTTAGADATGLDGSATTDGLRIQDVSIPVAIGYKIIKSRPAAFRIFAGVVPSFPTSVTDNDFGIVKEDLKSTLWAGRAGLGVDLSIVSIDAGYDFGLGDIFEPPLPSVKRNEWFINVGARFGF
ncbi:MAG: outer membrane beta-barrel protein [Gemmatimonadales bacterium]